MEHLIVTARNLRFLMDNKEKDFIPEIEVILTVVDKNIEFVGSSFASVEKTKTLRFTVNPEGARVFSKSLSDWADEAENKFSQLNRELENNQE